MSEGQSRLLHVLFIYFILVLFPGSTTANMSRAIDSATEEGKSLHKVFVQKGIDTSTVVDLVKSTIEHDYISPWSDADDELISMKFRATSSQIAKLKDHQDIVRVINVEFPVQDISTPKGKRLFVEGSYVIRPINWENVDQCNATGIILKALLDSQLTESMWDGKIRKWWATMTDEQVAEVKMLAGVSVVSRVHKGKRGRMTPTLSKPHESPNLRGPMKKRDITYETQRAAATELVAVSQPSTIPELRDLKNYVYESHGGSGSFVYHIETGVAFKAQSRHLLTKKAIENHDEPWVDDDEEMPSHGTCTAGKALGTQFGVSKQATLVVVRLHIIDHKEFQEALELILKDIGDHPERHKRSVVSTAISFVTDEWDDDDVIDFRNVFEKLFAEDIPFVCNSGNDDDESNDESELSDGADVDEYPGLMEGPDLPLIVVGSVNSQGQRSWFSKGGPHVTIHALGEDVLCMPKGGNVPKEDAGTSFAQPLVAGEIANLLSYDTVPFDTSDGNLVKNLKAYLQSDQASWERVEGVRVLWNGVTEENNPRKVIECNGLGENVYVEGDDVTSLIKDTFCPDVGVRRGLQGQSASVSSIYNIGTPNEVTLSLSTEEGLNSNYNEQDCVKYLMEAVDGCLSTDNNAANYKGGGSTTVGGATYNVAPGSLRSAAHYGKQAGCDGTYKLAFNDYWVWGHGWASSDYGESLKNELKGCALLPGTWHFDYGLGDDGREWTARFRTGVFQKKCVGNAVGTASGFGEFGCAGSGRD
ncbi:hypothetical protein CEP52_017540 [Fusarium oligoseptatum]|uniref:Peptidase S8/S53 domain-containing protein n=1 Tax=Fusarium oligoseptatum TaxID=2604345 RepID=A0A428RPA0_9HYPO|nr:hypothetical protein CEP52_017540 [Fusarium oligoseptatum]